MSIVGTTKTKSSVLFAITLKHNHREGSFDYYRDDVDFNATPWFCDNAPLLLKLYGARDISTLPETIDLIFASELLPNEANLKFICDFKIVDCFHYGCNLPSFAGTIYPDLLFEDFRKKLHELKKGYIYIRILETVNKYS